MRKNILLSFIVVISLFMSACSLASDEFDTTTVTSVFIDKEGTVESVIVEEFDKEYYDVDELKKMINDTINDFNRTHTGLSVELKACEYLNPELGSNKIRTVINYDSAKAYKEFNGEDMFFGTIKEAYEAGYDFNTVLYSAVDKSKYPNLDKQSILDMSDRHIFIMEENMYFKSTLKLSYISDGVEVIDRKTADMNNKSGYGMIIFNK